MPETIQMMRCVQATSSAAARSEPCTRVSYKAFTWFRSSRSVSARRVASERAAADAEVWVTKTLPAASAAWRSATNFCCNARSCGRCAAIFTYAVHAASPDEFSAVSCVMLVARTSGRGSTICCSTAVVAP